MNNLLYISLLAVAISFVYHNISFAVCVEGPPNTVTCTPAMPNPDPTGIQKGGDPNDITAIVLSGAGIDTILANGGNGGKAIDTGDGNDQITITGADIKGQSDALDSGDGVDLINITDSSLFGITDVIDISEGNSGSKTFNIVNSTLTTTSSDAIFVRAGSSIINITDSELFGPSEAISATNNQDQITIENSILTGSPISIELGNGDDILTLKTGAELVGRIECLAGFDTIIFAMDVPEERLNFFSAQIALATVPDGSITINGLFYEWTDCELLVNELVGVRVTRPIPTLTEWGLIATAGALGFIGFIFIRRRKAAV